MERGGARTRERILETAAAEFARYGSDAVTVRRLGAAAGLDNSSLYRHFASKAELHGAVLERAAEGALAALAPLASDAPPRLATLVGACAALAERLTERPDDARLLLGWIAAAPARTERSGPDDPGSAPARLLLALADWLTRARRAGTIRRVHVSEAAVTLAGALLLRPATAGSLLAESRAEPGGAVARRARVREVGAFVRGALRPLSEEVPLESG